MNSPIMILNIQFLIIIKINNKLFNNIFISESIKNTSRIVVNQ